MMGDDEEKNIARGLSPADSDVAKAAGSQSSEPELERADQRDSGTDAVATPQTAETASPAEEKPVWANSESTNPGGPDAVQGPRSLAPIWMALAASFILLLLGILYLFSTMPGADRLEQDEKALAELRTQNASLAANLATKGAAPDLTPLNQRIDAAEKQLSALRSDVAALKNRPASPATSEVNADATTQTVALAQRLADLEHKLGETASTAAGDKQAVGDLDQRLTALAAKVDALPKVDLGPLTARLDSVESRLQPIETEFKAAKSAQRVTEVRQNGSAAETRAAPLAVTSDAVLRAIDAGQPFAPDLKVLASLGAKESELQPLRAVADAGAPTVKDLRADLAALRDQISSQSAPRPTGSYLDRLMTGASSMVQVRPLGSVVGDTTPAILARMDDDLARDDLKAALDEWQKLPEPARQLAKGLADRIRLRQAAQTAAHNIGAQAIQAMAVDQP